MTRPTAHQTPRAGFDPFSCCRTYSASVKLRIQDKRLGALEFAIAFLAFTYFAVYEAYLHQTPFLRVQSTTSNNVLANCSDEATAATYTVSGQSTQFEGIFPKVGSSTPSLTVSDLRCDSSLSIYDYVQPGPNSVFVTTMLYDRVTAEDCAGSTAQECVGTLENFRFVALPPDLSLHVHHSWSTYWGHQEKTPLVCLQDVSTGVEAVSVVEGLSCDHPLSTAGEPYTKLFVGDLLLDAGISSIDERNMRWAGSEAPTLSGDDAHPTYRMSGAEVLAVMHYQTTGQSDFTKWGWNEGDMSGSVRVMLETREVPGLWSAGEPLQSTTSGGKRRETLRTGINVRFEPQGSVSVFSGRALLNAFLRTFALWAILKTGANLIAFRFVAEGDVYNTWRERHIDQRGAQTGRVPTEGGAQAVELSKSRTRARSASHARGDRKGGDSGEAAALNGGRRQLPSRADSSDFAFADRMEADKASRKIGGGRINRTAAAVPREITGGAGESKGSFSFGATPTSPSLGAAAAEPPRSLEMENRVAELERRIAELDATMTSYMESTKHTLRQLSADVTHHEQLLQGDTARAGVSPSDRLRGVQDPSDTNLPLEAAGLTQDTGQASPGEYASLLTTTPRGTRTLVPSGSMRGRNQFGGK